MIKGLFKAAQDFKTLRELQNSPAFPRCMEKLRTVHGKAMEALLTGPPDRVHDARGYARALDELLNELSRKEISP